MDNAAAMELQRFNPSDLQRSSGDVPIFVSLPAGLVPLSEAVRYVKERAVAMYCLKNESESPDAVVSEFLEGSLDSSHFLSAFASNPTTTMVSLHEKYLSDATRAYASAKEITTDLSSVSVPPEDLKELYNGGDDVQRMIILPRAFRVLQNFMNVDWTMQDVRVPPKPYRLVIADFATGAAPSAADVSLL